MFNKILIANRGEIACRVIKTARKMGIATVAVYSEADAGALHVDLADEAVCIGPAASKESYLVMDKIIAACKQTGAEAVHPGYGFLSENAEFSRRLEAEGIKFIGPKHYSVAKMGDKIESKKLAIEAKVNTIPGYNDPIETPEEAVEIAKGIGYPVMIKASAGGGGKGLRVAFNDKEAHEGFSSCRNEAKNAFGDDRVFIEKYVLEPRHIEIQVLGDSHGNYVYLNERDCSIQRRHQKVIEEAPSPFVDPEMRKAMGEQAVALARAVNYESAGTVEFVVSGATKEFYFLEMNTRLQVEHPVTELITGLDLVEQMIRVAYGEKLTITQADVGINGWSMECRINAEDPFRGFLPSTGRLVKFQPPAEVDGQVRVDTGVYEGGEISMYYDSMIAKLITHGANRDQAIERMREALNAFVIRGISSNIPFQAALLQHPRFVSGNFNTGFIAEEYPQGFDATMVPHDDPMLFVTVAAALHRRHEGRDAGISGQMPGHERVVGEDFMVIRGEERTPVTVVSIEGGYQVGVGGERFVVNLDWRFGETLVNGSVNGKAVTMQFERNGLKYNLKHNGTEARLVVMNRHWAELQALMPVKLPPDMSKFLLSPMPGLLREVAVKVGQEVKAGEKLAVIEAMKMENVLKADQDGKVAKIVAEAGASLSVDEVIIEFE
ncbi:acetyl-CoA carboxylase biotin carboxylase subunit [Azoarcus taiwanensis]|uniref:Biotin carboxylase n=1 Tax=Azoarcus taiwanensis TaxID=666964 RepID=A0A972F8I7_9RHOO|nr:acetyl-CoA carboxylase biotin carboxylase subunit [Azoarcus taiwanensis]NMG03912.1 acetyl-CoA carboxylase biotin carboxylase subunit [Azoarcus taiwanensis]